MEEGRTIADDLLWKVGSRIYVCRTSLSFWRKEEHFSLVVEERFLEGNSGCGDSCVVIIQESLEAHFRRSDEKTQHET